MTLMREGRWNFERGVCAALAACVFFSAYAYIAGLPRSIEDELADRPPRSSKLKEDSVVSVSLPGESQDPLTASRPDPFSPIQLRQQRTRPWRIVVKGPKPPKPHPRPPLPPIAMGVKLPKKPKPKVVKIDAPETGVVEKEKEKPFPLDIVIILRPETSLDSRRVVVKLKEGGSEYFHLREGDEVQAGGTETIQVVEITPTAVTFEREDGKLVKVDKDPLHAWRPLLRDEQEARPDGEVPEDSPPALRPEISLQDMGGHRPRNRGNTSGRREETQRNSSRRKQHTYGRNRQEITQPELESMLRNLREKNPGLVEQLGDIM